MVTLSRLDLLRPALFTALGGCALLVLLAPGTLAWTSGPDACGYEGVDSNEVSGPLYNFIDITATGVPAVGAATNNGQDVVALPFTFRFCGLDYTEVTVVSNGEVCMGVGPCDNDLYQPAPIPDASNPSPAVYGYATNLNPERCFTSVGAPPPAPACVLWEVQGAAPNRVFIYMQRNVPLNGGGCLALFQCAFDPGASFEIKLFEGSNCIETHFEHSMDSLQNHVVLSGIQEGATSGLQYLHAFPGPPISATAVRYCQVVIPPPTCNPPSQVGFTGQLLNFVVANGAPPFTWSAPGGSPAAGSGTNFATSYATPGAYEVEVTDSAGESSTCTVWIPPLTCLPAAQTVAALAPASLSALGGSGSYSWSSPGGAPATGGGTAFTTAHSAPGAHAVDLTSGLETVTCNVVVTEPECGYRITDPAPYDFTDITLTGMPATAGAASDDDYEQQPLNGGAGAPFVFSFCGVDYTSAFLSSNGYLCFDDSLDCRYNWFDNPLPYSWTARAAIFAYAGDLYPPACATACVLYETQGTAPERVFIYQMNDVPMFGGPSLGSTFQIKLYEGSDCFEVQYQSVQDSTGMHQVVAGFQDGGATASYTHAQSNPGWTSVATAWSGCNFRATPDAFVFNEDQTAQAFDVLANDVVVTGTPSVAAKTMPTKGTLTGPMAGVFTYTPDADASGLDGFDYTLTAPGKTSTAHVTLSINPVNDPPALLGSAATLAATPGLAPIVVAGWGTNVAAGPSTAVDEAPQSILFDRVSMTDPGIFTIPPVLLRSASATATEPSVPDVGTFALLRFTPSGIGGTSVVCFTPRDDGGTAVATNSWGAQAAGQDTGPTVCVTIDANAVPVAYFEPSSVSAAPGERVTFDPCPAPAPHCTHDPDGAIVVYLWEFGDGESSAAVHPAHAYRGTGRYDARLSVWDEDGATATAVRTIMVAWPGAGPLEKDGAAGSVHAPMADAGPDRTVLEGTQVQMAGSGGGTTARFQWRQVGGPQVDLQDAHSPNPSFAAPRLPTMAPLHLTFSLKVTDGPLTSPGDYVVIHVVSANHPPVAHAGPAMAIAVGSATVLDGSRSQDLDGDTLSYHWEQTLRPGERSVELVDADTHTPSFVSPGVPGLLHFRLTVSDGKATSEDHVTIEVRPLPAPATEEKSSPLQPVVPKVVAAETRSMMPMLFGTLGYLAVGVLLALLLVRSRRGK